MSILIRFVWHPVRGWPGSSGRGTGEPCTDQRLTRCKLFSAFRIYRMKCFPSISVKINKKPCKVSPHGKGKDPGVFRIGWGEVFPTLPRFVREGAVRHEEADTQNKIPLIRNLTNGKHYHTWSITIGSAAGIQCPGNPPGRGAKRPPTQPALIYAPDISTRSSRTFLKGYTRRFCREIYCKKQRTDTRRYKAI